MPQPLSTFSKVHSITFDTNALNNRPKMAILVASIFAASASVDHELSLLLVRVLGAEAAPALAIFSVLESQNLQRKALAAAASAHFEKSPSEFEIFSAVISAAECAQADRHRLAHGVWAKSEQLPDALLVVDPKALKDNTTAMKELRRGPGPKADNALKRVITLFDDIFVYKIADLERARRDLKEAEGVMSQYNVYLDPPATEEHAAKYGLTVGTSAEALRLLSTLRLFREALDRVRDKAAKNNPQPQAG